MTIIARLKLSRVVIMMIMMMMVMSFHLLASPIIELNHEVEEV